MRALSYLLASAILSTFAMPAHAVSASAGADPIITLDPSYVAEGYSLELSQNLSSTPLPSTWLMLFSGIMGLGLLVRRGTTKGSVRLLAFDQNT